MISEWIDIDSYKVNKPKIRSLEGARVNVSVAPFNIPKALKTSQKSGILNIEFIYSSSINEPEKHKVIDNNVNLTYGKRSGRLLKVEIPEDFEKSNPKMITLELEVKEVGNMLRNLMPMAAKINKDTLAIASSVLSKYSDDIAENFQATAY